MYSPFALPRSLRDLLEWGIHAVNMERDITFVAEYEVGLVVLVAAAFADGALKTAPTLLQDHLRDAYVHAVWVITLAALRAYNQPALLVRTEGPAHDANVLRQHPLVIGRHADQLVVFLLFLHPGLRSRTL